MLTPTLRVPTHKWMNSQTTHPCSKPTCSGPLVLFGFCPRIRPHRELVANATSPALKRLKLRSERRSIEEYNAGAELVTLPSHCHRVAEVPELALPPVVFHTCHSSVLHCPRCGPVYEKLGGRAAKVDSA